jgi:hypothetical protein
MPNEFKVKNGLHVSGSANINSSGSSVFTVDGTSGRLFQIDDSLSGSLFSVNTAAGLPIIEAFSDNTVRIGQFGQRALFVSQSKVGINKESALNGLLDISGSVTVTGSVAATSFTGSLLGTASFAVSASRAISSSFATTASFAVSASWAPGGGGSTTPGGANTTIQFNDAGAFSGSGNFTFNKTAETVGIGADADTNSSIKLLIRNGNAVIGNTYGLYFEESPGFNSAYIVYAGTAYGAVNGQDLTIFNNKNGVIKYNTGANTLSSASAHLWGVAGTDHMVLNAFGNLGIAKAGDIDAFDPFSFSKARLHVQDSGSAIFLVSGSRGQLFRVIDSGSAGTTVLATMSSGSRDVFTFTTSSLLITGSVVANIETDALHYGRIVVTPTGTQNDYSPAGWNDADPAKSTTINISGTNSLKITGLAGGQAGRVAVLKNTSIDRLIILEDSSSLSTATNRFDFRNPIFLLPNGSATLLYDGVDSLWQPMGTSGGIGFGAFFDTYDDFLGAVDSFTTTATEVGRFAGIGAGTGASGQASTYLINTTEKPLGVYQIDTGTTNTGRANLGSTDASSIIPANGQAIFLCRIAVEALSTAGEEYQIFAGFHDAVGSTNVTDGVYWEYRRGSSTAWQGATANNSTRTTTGAAGPTVDTNYIWLGIYLNSTWTRATYFYSTDSRTWTMAGELTTNLPTAARTTGFGVTINKTAGTNQRNCSIDMLAYRYDIQRG